MTFDPPLVERVVSLLHVVLDQNPLLPRLYLTGVFFFVLMYTGSNVLPLARFLKDVHLLQAFRLDEVSFECLLILFCHVRFEIFGETVYFNNRGRFGYLPVISSHCSALRCELDGEFI